MPASALLSSHLALSLAANFQSLSIFNVCVGSGERNDMKKKDIGELRTNTNDARQANKRNNNGKNE
jgi:hypothetical protein